MHEQANLNAKCRGLDVAKMAAQNRFWLIYVSSFFSLHKKNSKSGILFSMGILQKNVSEDYFM